MKCPDFLESQKAEFWKMTTHPWQLPTKYGKEDTPGQSHFQLFLVWLGSQGSVLAPCSLTHTSLDHHQTPV